MTDEKKDEPCLEPEVYGPTPPAVFKPLWVGRRWAGGIRRRANGTPIKSEATKPFRRAVRKLLVEDSPVARELEAVRRDNHEVQRLSSNSHEAKRMIEKARKERQAARAARREATEKALLGLKLQKAAGTDKPLEQTTTMQTSPTASSDSPSNRP